MSRRLRILLSLLIAWTLILAPVGGAWSMASSMDPTAGTVHCADHPAQVPNGQLTDGEVTTDHACDHCGSCGHCLSASLWPLLNDPHPGRFVIASKLFQSTIEHLPPGSLRPPDIA
ncbi:hypothetical protein Tgr7_2507 [Thioalkalivibrio sulfidiphilus HL-EbGr7]|uniref:DUF2946 domain-containing protein n=1 Tax=Thioalkalivibrio sulfidiphilus (strain HL-EbGR7) TaxID=396588 RepID=B8GLM9_THISH|nr:hypothetical protein [Thioalkalivibrio sulfidiphilus]ACL73584.1 hypothetical protein Tgr7_2507 [Thioalkalivibrio sulfidiphilus HL-EbGr7]